jgi:hypothetical protein
VALSEYRAIGHLIGQKAVVNMFRET